MLLTQMGGGWGKVIRKGFLELGYMSTVLRDNYNLGEEKMGKSEKKASAIHRFERSWQLGNGKKHG